MRTTMAIVHSAIKSRASEDGGRSKLCPGVYFRPFFWLSLGSGNMDATENCEYWREAFYPGKVAA